MKTLPRKSFFFICASVSVGILMSLLVPGLVQADVGVQPILPGGSNIQPGEETSIQMAAEVVVMNVRPATEADNALLKLNPKVYGFDLKPVWFPGIAEVEADFAMENPTDQAVSLTVWFPLASALENANWNFIPGEIVPRIESFQVSVDGKSIDYIESDLPNPKGANKPPLPWASFPITFPGRKETVIHVSYMLPLQPSPKGKEMALYYIFQTGAGWAGPIGQAELILNLPYPASVETMATMNRLSLPPFNMGQVSAGLPSGVILNGNQARWKWIDFEPDSSDDFAVWLLKPDKWQELETARAAIQANPNDGQAWLALASIYNALSLTGTNTPLLFSPFYLPQGVKAYQKAINLLPDNPAGHAGWALLTLAPYQKTKNAPPEVIKSIQNELQTAKDLEARNPTLVNETGISRYLIDWLEQALSSYFYNDATATMDAATRAVYNSTLTANATLEYATRTLWAAQKATNLAVWSTSQSCIPTSGAVCTAIATPTISLTPSLTLTETPVPFTVTQPSPTNTGAVNNGSWTVFLVICGSIGLLVVVYLVVKRFWKN